MTLSFEHAAAWELRPIVEKLTEENADLRTKLEKAREALKLHKMWADSERSGPNYKGLSRSTHPHGEAIWRAWWENNLSLCAKAEETTATVLKEISDG